MSEHWLVQHVWLIPLLPLVATVITAVLGPRVLRQRSHWPCVLGAGGAAVLAIGLLVTLVGLQTPTHDTPVSRHGQFDTAVTYRWITVGEFAIPVTLRVDPLTALMLVMVTFVGTLIVIYSVGYLHHDPGYWRFFTYVAFFLFSMTMLVLSSNFLLLYVFWEAVGLCSYLLIGFWYQRPAAAAAAKKAFLVNRIGDFGFALGILLLWISVKGFSPAPGTTVLDYDHAFAHVSEISSAAMVGICLLLFCGAVGKSAQFPLHVWLPDAMEGPTPVSALIHAATMVTAGVYMVARFTPLFAAAPEAQVVVAVIGGTTALLAALIALTQVDLKRILAYSTVSQLGYMFLALGCGSLLGVTAGIFHVFTHAFFKALLFLGAGSVMHAMGNVIDIRRFSGLRRRLPITCITFLCGAAALSGLPLLSGFWSKDAILAAVAERAHGGYAGGIFSVLLVVGLVTAFLTAFYTFRAFFKTFWGDERIPEEAGHHAHESPPVMVLPLAVLAVFALFLGLCLGPTGALGHFLEQTPGWAALGAEPEGHNLGLMVNSSLIALAGVALAWFFYGGISTLPEKLARQFRLAYNLSFHKFWLDEIYQGLILSPLIGLADLCKSVDYELVDGLVRLVAGLPARIARACVRPLQNGLIQFYALSMLLGLVLMLLFGLWFSR
ncbi:MAG: NADH-quinone oxidoreductase subunit L [Planctomycetota bacterium]|nr:NADH-quinone oxidoreductase subunit L [Planctomycetota bacterium]